jgi:hypothetical protein
MTRPDKNPFCNLQLKTHAADSEPFAPIEREMLGFVASQQAARVSGFD